MTGLLQLINVSLVKYDDLLSQVFDPQCAHLVPGMALQFLKVVLYFSEKIFKALVVDLEKNKDLEVQASVSGSGTMPLTNEPRKDKTKEEKLEEVIEDIETRRMNYDLVFVRIREELDFMANQKKEDRIVVTGMVCNIAQPSDQVKARL